MPPLPGINRGTRSRHLLGKGSNRCIDLVIERYKDVDVDIQLNVFNISFWPDFVA